MTMRTRSIHLFVLWGLLALAACGGAPTEPTPRVPVPSGPTHEPHTLPRSILLVP